MKDPKIFLVHIRESIQQIEAYVGGFSHGDFVRSLQVQDAVVRRLEIIGEATKNIPDDFKERYPDIPWKKIANMRNTLIHEYFSVDVEILWNLLDADLKKFKEQVETLLGLDT